VRMRLSRARIQEFLHDWLRLALDMATINQCIHEAGPAVHPVVQGDALRAVRQTRPPTCSMPTWRPSAWAVGVHLPKRDPVYCRHR
jgi:transposase